MASLNKVQIIGHVGMDPEVRYTPGGDPVANLSIATSFKWTDKSTGEKKEETEWHRVVVYKQQADFVDKYVTKGALMYIEGRIKTRKWKDKQDQDRYTTEIIAERTQLLGGKPAVEKETSVRREQEQASAATPSAATTAPKGHFDDLEDDIPF